MQGLSSAVLSLAAMALSSLTTYLTFFDSRYTVTVAVSNVELQLQTSSSSSGDGTRNAYYRLWPTAQMIFSNRGTRAVVLSDMQLVRSNDLGSCEPDEEAYDTRIEPLIIEPGAVEPLSVEFELEPVSFVFEEGANDPIPGPETQHWCMRWTAFDPEGRRREPVTSFFTVERSFTPPETDRSVPRMEIDLDYPRAPETSVAKGLF